ncbi:MAG: helix-hairpin-helix domain-containing protein [Streptococcaceae bacterium]|jgi:competence protein ComEA|nr:helix-hairpin-helix domain-containing protein [Streptococcaceae bacterium]
MNFEEFWLAKKRLIIGVVIIINLMVLCLLLFLHLSPPKKAEDVDFLQSTNISLDKQKQEISKTSNSASSAIYVDVKGAVNKPGMYSLADGKRVNDVIKMAGGLTDQADTKQVNYALKLVDQMIVYIPQIGEIVENNVSTISSTNQKVNKKINLNTATLEELQTLTGIGAKKAQKIINYREANGLFTQVDDLQNVDGFGAKTVEKLKESLTV